jgi:ADP-glucose pyrophosphorylase
MAYSRFIGSDIYIYSHVSGHIECQACFLNEPTDEYSLFSMSEYITNDDQLRDHLEEHARAGHNMPENLLQDILADPDRYGEYTP